MAKYTKKEFIKRSAKVHGEMGTLHMLFEAAMPSGAPDARSIYIVNFRSVKDGGSHQSLSGMKLAIKSKYFDAKYVKSNQRARAQKLISNIREWYEWLIKYKKQKLTRKDVDKTTKDASTKAAQKGGTTVAAYQGIVKQTNQSKKLIKELHDQEKKDDNKKNPKKGKISRHLKEGTPAGPTFEQQLLYIDQLYNRVLDVVPIRIIMEEAARCLIKKIPFDQYKEEICKKGLQNLPPVFLKENLFPLMVHVFLGSVDPGSIPPQQMDDIKKSFGINPWVGERLTKAKNIGFKEKVTAKKFNASLKIIANANESIDKGIEIAGAGLKRKHPQKGIYIKDMKSSIEAALSEIFKFLNIQKLCDFLFDQVEEFAVLLATKGLQTAWEQTWAKAKQSFGWPPSLNFPLLFPRLDLNSSWKKELLKGLQDLLYQFVVKLSGFLADAIAESCEDDLPGEMDIKTFLPPVDSEEVLSIIGLDKDDLCAKDIGNMLGDLSLFLTPGEICKLFEGEAVAINFNQGKDGAPVDLHNFKESEFFGFSTEEATTFIKNFVTKRYPRCILLFPSEQQIADFFKRLGSLASGCPDVVARKKSFCETDHEKEVNKLRAKFLCNKGYDQKKIDQLIKNTMAQRRKRLGELLDNLFDEDAFDSFMPPSNCYRDPKTNKVVPGIVPIPQSMEFMIDEMLDGLYDAVTMHYVQNINSFVPLMIKTFHTGKVKLIKKEIEKFETEVVFEGGSNRLIKTAEKKTVMNPEFLSNYKPGVFGRTTNPSGPWVRYMHDESTDKGWEKFTSDPFDSKAPGEIRINVGEREILPGLKYTLESFSLPSTKSGMIKWQQRKPPPSRRMRTFRKGTKPTAQRTGVRFGTWSGQGNEELFTRISQYFQNKFLNESLKISGFRTGQGLLPIDCDDLLNEFKAMTPAQKKKAYKGVSWDKFMAGRFKQICGNTEKNKDLFRAAYKAATSGKFDCNDLLDEFKAMTPAQKKKAYKGVSWDKFMAGRFKRICGNTKKNKDLFRAVYKASTDCEDLLNEFKAMAPAQKKKAYEKVSWDDFMAGRFKKICGNTEKSRKRFRAVYEASEALVSVRGRFVMELNDKATNIVYTVPKQEKNNEIDYSYSFQVAQKKITSKEMKAMMEAMNLKVDTTPLSISDFKEKSSVLKGAKQVINDRGLENLIEKYTFLSSTPQKLFAGLCEDVISDKLKITIPLQVAETISEDLYPVVFQQIVSQISDTISMSPLFKKRPLSDDNEFLLIEGLNLDPSPTEKQLEGEIDVSLPNFRELGKKAKNSFRDQRCDVDPMEAMGKRSEKDGVAVFEPTLLEKLAAESALISLIRLSIVDFFLRGIFPISQIGMEIGAKSLASSDNLLANFFYDLFMDQIQKDFLSKPSKYTFELIEGLKEDAHEIYKRDFEEDHGKIEKKDGAFSGKISDKALKFLFMDQMICISKRFKNVLGFKSKTTLELPVFDAPRNDASQIASEVRLPHFFKIEGTPGIYSPHPLFLEKYVRLSEADISKITGPEKKIYRYFLNVLKHELGIPNPSLPMDRQGWRDIGVVNLDLANRAFQRATNKVAVTLTKDLSAPAKEILKLKGKIQGHKTTIKDIPTKRPPKATALQNAKNQLRLAKENKKQWEKTRNRYAKNKAKYHDEYKHAVGRVNFYIKQITSINGTIKNINAAIKKIDDDIKNEIPKLRTKIKTLEGLIKKEEAKMSAAQKAGLAAAQKLDPDKLFKDMKFGIRLIFLPDFDISKNLNIFLRDPANWGQSGLFALEEKAFHVKEKITILELPFDPNTYKLSRDHGKAIERKIELNPIPLTSVEMDVSVSDLRRFGNDDVFGFSYRQDFQEDLREAIKKKDEYEFVVDYCCSSSKINSILTSYSVMKATTFNSGIANNFKSTRMTILDMWKNLKKGGDLKYKDPSVKGTMSDKFKRDSTSQGDSIQQMLLTLLAKAPWIILKHLSEGYDPNVSLAKDILDVGKLITELGITATETGFSIAEQAQMAAQLAQEAAAAAGQDIPPAVQAALDSSIPSPEERKKVYDCIRFIYDHIPTAVVSLPLWIFAFIWPTPFGMAYIPTDLVMKIKDALEAESPCSSDAADAAGDAGEAAKDLLAVRSWISGQIDLDKYKDIEDSLCEPKGE